MPSVQPGAQNSVCQGWLKVAWRDWGGRRPQEGQGGEWEGDGGPVCCSDR